MLSHLMWTFTVASMPTWYCLMRPHVPMHCLQGAEGHHLGSQQDEDQDLLSTRTPLDLGLTVNLPVGVDQQAGMWRACPLQRPPQMFLGQLLASLNSVLRKSKAQKEWENWDNFVFFFFLIFILSNLWCFIQDLKLSKF